MNKEEKQKEILVILHESLLVSWLKDIVSFGSLAAMLYANYHYLGNRTSIVVFILFMWFMIMIARTNKVRKAVPRVTNREEAMEIVNRYYPL